MIGGYCVFLKIILLICTRYPLLIITATEVIIFFFPNENWRFDALSLETFHRIVWIRPAI